MWILKEYAMLIAPILKVIYTQSYQTGYLPSDWLTANIVPVYKKGDKSIPANYRPISLTSVCCKTMEHIIYHSITDHLNTYNIINLIQYDFRPGLSCKIKLILLIEEILRAMDQNHRFLEQDPPDIRMSQYYLHHSISHFTCLSHQQRFIPPITSTKYYQKSFFPHTITD